MPHKSCYRRQGRYHDAFDRARICRRTAAPLWSSQARVKKRILDEFCQTTGMHHKAAIRLLAKRARATPRRALAARCYPSLRLAKLKQASPRVSPLAPYLTNESTAASRSFASARVDQRIAS